MEYMLLIHADPKGFDALTETQRAQGMAAYTAFTEALRKAEVLRNSNRLRPAETGTTVRIRDGKTEVLEWTLHRDARAAGRLLPDRRCRPRRGARLGGALPRRRATARWKCVRCGRP